jgi:hypothetical protein
LELWPVYKQRKFGTCLEVHKLALTEKEKRDAGDIISRKHLSSRRTLSKDQTMQS